MLIYSPDTRKQSCKSPRSIAMALKPLFMVFSFRSCMHAESASSVKTLMVERKQKEHLNPPMLAPNANYLVDPKKEKK